MKLNKSQIEEIKLLKGKKSSFEIAKEFNVSQSAIIYWNSNRDKCIQREKDYVKKLSPEQKKERYAKQKIYQKIYRKNRYKIDPKFREKIKERAREYKRKSGSRNNK